MAEATTSAFARGRYAVARELGRGGMAVVYLAHDAELDRPVAVKVLDGHVANDPELVARFRREAMTAARLSHPNVVRVYDAGEDEGRLWIVMELVDGEALDRIAEREGRLEPGRAVELAVQACAGIGYAHEQGVVHRDVKPANLLVRPDGVLKVADFGIARAADATRLTAAGTILGTAAFMAPEGSRGEPVGPPADVFSLGVVIYRLLTGVLPWPVESLSDLAAVGERPARPLRELAPEVSRDVEAAVMRALARNPSYRQRNARELDADLRGRGEPDGRAQERATTAAATVPLPEARGHARRHPWRLALAALALAAIVLALLLAALEGDDEGPAPVEPVPRADDAAEQARELERWLRDHTRGRE